MEENRHAIEVCYAATGFSPVTVYAHCVCGWQGQRRPLTLTTATDGQDTGIITAKEDGQNHLEAARGLLQRHGTPKT
jgi:hypothetical protein